MSEYIVDVTETTTRRIVLNTTSEKKARQLIEAGTLSYLKAAVSEDITSMKREILSVAKKEKATGTVSVNCPGLISPVVQFDTITGYTCDECGATCGSEEEFVHGEVKHEVL